MKWRAGLALAGTVAGLATAYAHDRTSTRVTWDREVSPIVQARCVTCHRAGGRGPMPLGTYAEARPWARAIKEQVLTRRMPKWHGTRGYGDLANDPSLSPFEIAIVAAWVDGGAPEKPLILTPAGQPAMTPGPASLAVEPPPGARVVTLACGTQPLPAGRLLAVRPALAPGRSAGVAALLPDGRREILVMVRNYEPAFPETYWLRTPLRIDAGSRLHVEAGEPCTVDAIVER